MNEKLKEFLDAKKDAEKKAHEEKKKDTLIELGLFEKEYSEKNQYSIEYPWSEWDSANSTNKYYKKVPVEITDEEYQEVKKYAKPPVLSTENMIAKALIIIASAVFVLGFIGGIVAGSVTASYNDEFNFVVALITWIASAVNGTMFLGFAEIIKLLTDIKNK